MIGIFGEEAPFYCNTSEEALFCWVYLEGAGRVFLFLFEFDFMVKALPGYFIGVAYIQAVQW